MLMDRERVYLWDYFRFTIDDVIVSGKTIALFMLVCLSCEVLYANAAPRPYQIPFAGGYLVTCGDADAPEPYCAPYLVGPDRTVALTHISGIAVHGPFIVGACDAGYFMIDTLHVEAPIVTYTDVEKWKHRLQVTGVNEDIQLKDPTELVKTMDEHVVHPARFRVMGGMLGLADDLWAGIVQITGLAFMFLSGRFVRSRLRLLLIAIVMGLLVDFVAVVVLGDGGLPACSGVIMFPAIYYIAGEFGKFIGGQTKGIGVRRQSR